MDTVKILLVEDAQDQINIFSETVEVYNTKYSSDREIKYSSVKTLEEAKKKIKDDRDYDGAIVDLKLSDDQNGGNNVVKQMREYYIRIPVIFVTGFPDIVIDDPIIIHKRARGTESYESDFDHLYNIKKTGLTNIMSGRGQIERALDTVYTTNLLNKDNLAAWIEYGQHDKEKSEKALLRYTVNHLIQFLDDDENYFPEEAYIHPPYSSYIDREPMPSKMITTGSIVKKQTETKYFVVMNPACDLVIRDSGEPKTDRILVAEIENEKEIRQKAVGDCTNQEKKERKIKEVYKNNYCEYLHWLPETKYFFGGLINFRKINTYDKDTFNKNFFCPEIQISPFFIKDIISRFSAYYSRQGQPDIDITVSLGKAMKE